MTGVVGFLGGFLPLRSIWEAEATKWLACLSLLGLPLYSIWPQCPALAGLHHEVRPGRVWGRRAWPRRPPLGWRAAGCSRHRHAARSFQGGPTLRFAASGFRSTWVVPVLGRCRHGRWPTGWLMAASGPEMTPGDAASVLPNVIAADWSVTFTSSPASAAAILFEGSLPLLRDCRGQTGQGRHQRPG